jgi:hypothetical protein
MQSHLKNRDSKAEEQFNSNTSASHSSRFMQARIVGVHSLGQVFGEVSGRGGKQCTKGKLGLDLDVAEDGTVIP